jgi:hypothetical protein
MSRAKWLALAVAVVLVPGAGLAVLALGWARSRRARRDW